MNILVRQLTKDRIQDFLKKIDLHFIPFPLSNRVDLKLFSEKLADYAVHFSIEDDNQLIGLCCTYINDSEKKSAFISIVCLDPNYCGIGLGKRLIQECENYAKKRSYKSIASEVHIENLPSIKMFKAIGYYIEKQENESLFMKKLI